MADDGGSGVHDAGGDDLGLARTGAGNDLEVGDEGGDGEVHEEDSERSINIEYIIKINPTIIVPKKRPLNSVLGIGVFIKPESEAPSSKPEIKAKIQVNNPKITYVIRRKRFDGLWNV